MQIAWLIPTVPAVARFTDTVSILLAAEHVLPFIAVVAVLR